MKTIFITAFHGFVSRNIFNSSVLRTLADTPNVRIVLCVPPNKSNFIEKLYGRSNVLVQGVDLDATVRSRWQKFWYRAAFILQNTQYVKDQRRERLEQFKNIFGYINFGFISVLAFIASRYTWAKFMFRYFDNHLAYTPVLYELFHRYTPDLVFATDVFREEDSLFLRESRRWKIKTIGMVRSWDNTTTKGLLRLVPDSIIAPSPVIEEELIAGHACPAHIIFVSGLPQFDDWTKGPRVSRDDFFKQLGIDPAKKLLLFAPAGAILSKTDWQLCEILRKAIACGELPSDIHILVRNHPQHPADLARFVQDPHFTIETPGSRPTDSDFKAAELSPDEHEHLMHSVYYSEMVMYIATSLSLDATVFNKPQILISFDGYERVPFIHSVRRYNREDCLANLVKLGGVRVVYNEREWIHAIQRYLSDPSLDDEGRQKTAERHMFRIDGESGARIATHILQCLK